MNRLFAEVGPLALMVVAVAVLALGSADVAATPIGIGTEIKLEFESTPTPWAPWDLSVWAKVYVNFENGFLHLSLRSMTGGGFIEDVKLWEGLAVARDSFAVEHQLQPPAPGMYSLSAGLVPFPDGRPHGTFEVSSIWYIKVTPDTVFLARSSNRENIIDEIRYDARKRGVGDLQPEAWDSLAPDLAERWFLLHHRSAITTTRPAPKGVTIEASEEERSNPYRDSIAFPGWGPPEPRARPDSVVRKAMDREPRPRRQMPAPPPRRTPGDSEFGRSERAQKLRELFQQILDTSQARPDTGSSAP